MLSPSIARLSGVLKSLAWTTIAITAAGCAYALSRAPVQMSQWVTAHSGAPQTWAFSTLSLILWGALVVVLAASGIYVLWRLATLFALYQKGEALSDAAARAIRLAGVGLIVRAGLGVLARPLESLIVTLDAPAGQHMVAIAFDASDLWLVLAGGLVLVIGAVTRDAVAIARENEAFV